jgi:hypothetical protein
MSFDRAQDDDLGQLDDDEPLLGDDARRDGDDDDNDNEGGRDETDSYYALLNVSKDASTEDITKRYKALAGKN